MFLLNGRKIKFKGVNHHDTSPTNGYAMTPDEIERDVLLCKQFNIDTIRTSRYQMDFRWNDGSSVAVRPNAAPLSRAAVRVALGKPVDGTQTVTVATTDTRTGQVDSEEQIILAQKVRSAPAVKKLPEGYSVGGGRLICGQDGRTVMTSALQGTLLYRAATDNDTDLVFRNGMSPYMARPQESGNRMNCIVASVSDGRVKVTFEAVDNPFELGIKHCTAKALCAMKHRKDEVRTGTYVTIQAFQQGIGTGACGPGIMPGFKYSAKQEYTLKFIIRVEAERPTARGGIRSAAP